MGIKRYIADADTTITNAFRHDLREGNRATGSNMGASDVMEVFSIFNQGPLGQYTDASSGSVELSRALIKFPISEVSTDRTNSVIPGSGSVQFYLRMYNAKHSFTLPVSSTVSVVPVSQSWEEGIGLDMEEYSDKTRDGAGTCWVNKSSGSAWDTKGGQFHSGTNSNYTAHFANGAEDIEIDISQVVEDWIAGTKDNYGLGVFLTSSLEGYFSSSTSATTASVLHNLAGTTTSYYTKKFFSRSSEYFFQRPCIEARWYSAKKDDRGNTFVSSSLVTNAENINTVFLYNNVRGQLRNLPDVGTVGAVIFVQLYTSASNGELIKNSSPYNIRQTGALGDKPPQHALTGGYVSTGIYSCSFAVNTTASVLYDRWFSGSSAGVDIESATVYYTGSVVMNQFSSSADNFNPNPKYATKITNLKDTYSRDEIPRFRVFVREKDWSPNVYTIATKNIKSSIINKAYFKIIQISDDSTIIPFGTGSVTEYTSLSYDSKGNYFDLDMDLFEAGYAYGIKLAYYVNGAYHEQSEVFKFRVE